MAEATPFPKTCRPQNASSRNMSSPKHVVHEFAADKGRGQKCPRNTIVSLMYQRLLQLAYVLFWRALSLHLFFWGDE